MIAQDQKQQPTTSVLKARVKVVGKPTKDARVAVVGIDRRGLRVRAVRGWSVGDLLGLELSPEEARTDSVFVHCEVVSKSVHRCGAHAYEWRFVKLPSAEEMSRLEVMAKVKRTRIPRLQRPSWLRASTAPRLKSPGQP